MHDLRIAPREIEESAFEVLKEGDLFLTTLPDGEIPAGNMAGLGLYYRDTRFLSCLEHFLNDTRPVLLSSTTRGSHFSQIELSNGELITRGDRLVPLQSIHLRLLRVMRQALFQRLRLVNYNMFEVDLTLRVLIGSDFRDIFEIRGHDRPRRGRCLEPVTTMGSITLRYRGLDEIVRGCHVAFDVAPVEMRTDPDRALCTFKLVLPPQRKVHLTWLVKPVLEPDGGPSAARNRPGSGLQATFVSTAVGQADEYRAWASRCTQFTADNEIFNRSVARSVTDLRALYTVYPDGRIVEAGIPWYAAPFGRDALITSWQTLCLNPDIARDSLRFLSRHQGLTVDESREVEPGKILHEMRRGEMANCQEILHTPYYGSIDATPLFVIVLGEYHAWTGDLLLVKEMRDGLSAALSWCRKYGDRDGDGYIEYLGQVRGGLTNQGWKDSWDAVVRPDGTLAEPPIALVEVQAYWYLALVHGARLLRLLGEEDTARNLLSEAQALQSRFIRDFWIPRRGFLGFALDGRKNLLETVASNMGQCLVTGILDPESAVRVARRLFQPDMFSGWGIRTLSKWEKAYNPMSYHNNSVWPHDNAIIAAGLRRYGLFAELEQLFDRLYEASLYFPYYRLPELFCGFTRRLTGGPVRYPIACDPQAWAIGSTFMFLQAMLGLTCAEDGLWIDSPLLPAWLGELTLKNLRVHGGVVDLGFSRKHGRTHCHLLRKEGDFRVLIEA
ncbi:MAG: amylo-alpha-1,6-glucosidase [Candidatus Desulforudis sp.]|nr:amylo-alpha-1,6-glucosidase [Desulforudis sp.]